MKKTEPTSSELARPGGTRRPSRRAGLLGLGQSGARLLDGPTLAPSMRMLLVLAGVLGLCLVLLSGTDFRLREGSSLSKLKEASAEAVKRLASRLR